MALSDTRTYYQIRFHDGNGHCGTWIYQQKYDTPEEAIEDGKEYFDARPKASFDILEIRESVYLEEIHKENNMAKKQPKTETDSSTTHSRLTC